MLEILQLLILPSNFALLLLWLGLTLYILGKPRYLAITLLIASALTITVFSSGIVASALLAPLEYHHAIDKRRDNCEIENIVVLTGYASDDKNWPLSSRVSSSTAYRLIEATHLLQKCPARTITISGNRSARIIKDVLVGLGIEETAIVFDADSQHTDASARALHTMLGTNPFLLVTSAGHMPRAMGVFGKLGMQPIASPTDFSLSKNPFHSPLSPTPMHLQYSNLAINEYAGLIWYYLSGKI